MACSVCSSPTLVPSVRYGAIPLCDAYAAQRPAALAVHSYDLTAMSCPECGHGELAEKPPEDEIYAEYKYFSSNSPDLDAHFTGYADWISKKLRLGAGATHVDIGCNDGLLLEKTRNLGLRPVGIDPSPAALRARQKGLDVFQGYLTDEVVNERKLAGTADLVTCNNVMANVRDLLGFGRNIHRVLKEDGAFVVETLHYPTLLHNLVFEMINHEHYHYFSTRSIGRFFQRLGMELVACEHVATKGANMRCTARNADAGGRRREPVIDPFLLDMEGAIDAELGRFRATLEGTRTAISEAIDAARSRGPIAAFGSSAGTTILMYLLGIQDRFDYLVDDNPERHGLFAPGSGLPVVSPAEYYRRNPGLTVIFAWRFGEQIARKHRPHLLPQHEFVLANTGARI